MRLNVYMLPFGALCASVISGSVNLPMPQAGSITISSLGGTTPVVATGERSDDERGRRDNGYDRGRRSRDDVERSEERREEEMRSRGDQRYDREGRGREGMDDRESGSRDEERLEREMGSRNEGHDRFYDGENGRFRPGSDDSDE